MKLLASMRLLQLIVKRIVQQGKLSSTLEMRVRDQLTRTVSSCVTALRGTLPILFLPHCYPQLYLGYSLTTGRGRKKGVLNWKREQNQTQDLNDWTRGLSMPSHHCVFLLQTTGELHPHATHSSTGLTLKICPYSRLTAKTLSIGKARENQIIKIHFPKTTRSLSYGFL